MSDPLDNLEEWIKTEEWRRRKTELLSKIYALEDELKDLERKDPKGDNNKKLYKQIRKHLKMIEFYLWNI